MMGNFYSVLDRVQLRKPPGMPGSAAPAILIGLFVSFGGILFGYAYVFQLIRASC
jgi:hypothetical protein